MKKCFILICLFCTAINGIAQTNQSSKDSISTFYNALFSTMKTDYLYKDTVNWPQLEREVNENLTTYSDFKSSLKEVTNLFDKAGATHCSVFFEDAVYAFTYDGPTEKDFSTSWLKAYRAKPQFEVTILEEVYGYILMPSINFEDISSENIHAIAQPLYDQINAIKESNNIKGWIIDLRFNTGGNCQPMLLALYDFLGDNAVFGVLNIDKKRVGTTKLKKGKYYDSNQLISFITPKGNKLTEAKVAVITGPVTASSGEVVALAFKGRENTIFIGEKSMGKTTTNTVKQLPFGAYMAITIGYDCVRNGIFYDRITPDIEIIKEDNFEDISADQNIIEAIGYFNR